MTVVRAVLAIEEINDLYLGTKFVIPVLYIMYIDNESQSKMQRPGVLVACIDLTELYVISTPVDACFVFQTKRSQVYQITPEMRTTKNLRLSSGVQKTVNHEVDKFNISMNAISCQTNAYCTYPCCSKLYSEI